MKDKPLVYIAAPFRAGTAWRIELNVRVAEWVALEVWKAGAIAICPHTNSRFFHGELPDHVFLDGYMDLVKRCDAVCAAGSWELSRGASAEIGIAQALGRPVFLHWSHVVPWVPRWQSYRDYCRSCADMGNKPAGFQDWTASGAPAECTIAIH